MVGHAFLSLRPFAPRPLRRFLAPMGALTPVQQALRLMVSMNTLLTTAQVSLRPVPRRHDHSVSTHPTHPAVAFARYPLATSVSHLSAG